MVPDNDETGFAAAKEVKKSLPDTIVLDYRNLGAKDIGELVLKENAEYLFAEVVREQVWDTPFTKYGLMKYMPVSNDSTQLHLT